VFPFRRPLVMAVAVAVIAGCSGSNPPKFRTAKLERGTIESLVSATGTVRPVVQVNVGSQVSGTVLKLQADYNDRVKRGQVLLELDASSFRARAVQSEASVARSQAALKEAERQFKRAQELMGEGYIPQSELEGKEVAVEQGRADLQQAEAQLQAARVDLGNTVIRSPIDGVVIARSVDLGQTVAASLQAPQLFLIANDLADMQVETRIDEADIGAIRPGLEARFTVDAFPDEQFVGKVHEVRLEPIAEQGVVTYTTVIHTSNPDLKLRPGMTANVSILIDRREDVLMAPAAALRFRPPGPPQGGNAAGRNTAAGNSGGGAASVDTTPSAQRVRARAEGGMARGGQNGQGRRGPRSDGGEAVPQLKPGAVYVLSEGKPERKPVMTGLSNGSSTEIVGEDLVPGSEVIIGLEMSASANAGQTLQPPPGMGGRGGGGGGGGGGGRGRR
jgi:HlyD family secretion protein